MDNETLKDRTGSSSGPKFLVWQTKYFSKQIYIYIYMYQKYISSKMHLKKYHIKF